MRIKGDLTKIERRGSTEISEKISAAIGECPCEFVVDDILSNLHFDADDVGTIESLIAMELHDFIQERRIGVSEKRKCYYFISKDLLKENQQLKDRVKELENEIYSLRELNGF